MTGVEKQASQSCLTCGKPFQKRGSMTQWIFDTESCSCTSQSTTESTLPKCALCGLPIRTRLGSITHWIFRTHVCECLVTDENSENLSTQELPKDDIIPGAPYEFCGVIGTGGVATVYKAKSKKLGRYVAIKVLQQGVDHERAAQSFSREAKAASKLSHPNVVTVQDFGEMQNGRQYLVTEWIQGITLAQHIARKGRLPVSTAQEIFSQVLDGLSHAHNRGVIHRDIKPSNIMLARGDSGGWTVKIIDFGTAKEIDNEGEMTRAEDMACSPFYMSPEQATGERVDVRSDLYSVGCTLFEVLTGRTPFVGKSLSVVMRHQLEDPPTLKHGSGGADFPPSMEIVVRKLLSKEPSRRYQSAEDAKDALLGRRTKKTITKTFEFLIPPGLQSPATDARKGPWLVIAALAAIVIVAGALFVPFIMQSGPEVPHKTTVQKPKDPSPFQKNAATSFSDSWSDAIGKEHELLPEQSLSSLEPKSVTALTLGRRYPTKKADSDNLDEASRNYAQHRLEGLQRFPHLRHIAILNLPVTEGTVELIAGMSDLTSVTIGDTKVPQNTVEILSVLTKLRSLELEGVSHNKPLPLAGLSKLTNLTWLSFDDTAIGDAESLVELSQLDTLSLIRSQITDRALSYIAQIPNLHTLIVHENKGITRKGCEAIVQSKSLTSLIVGFSQFGDDGVKELAKSETLAAIDFTRSLGITDKSIPLLAYMRKLTKVDLTGTDVSADGIGMLRDMRPALEVRYTPNILEIQEVLPTDEELDRQKYQCR